MDPLNDRRQAGPELPQFPDTIDPVWFAGICAPLQALFPFTSCRILLQGTEGSRPIASYDTLQATTADTPMVFPLSHAGGSPGQIIFTSHKEIDPSIGRYDRARSAADLLDAVLSDYFTHRQEEQVLLDLADQLVKTRTRGDLVRLVDAELRKLLHFTHCSIGLLNEDHVSFSPFFTSANVPGRNDPEYTEFFSRSHPVDDGVFGVALRAGKPCIFNVDRVTADPSCPSYMEMNRRNGSKEFITMSLPGESGPLGVIGFFTDRKGEADERRLRLLKGISSQISIAVSNIIAYEEIELKKQEKTILLSLSNDIAAIRNKEDLRQVTISRIRALLGSEVILIDLLNAEEQTHAIYFVDNDQHALQFPEYLERDEKNCPIADGVYDKVLAADEVVVIDIPELMKGPAVPDYVKIWDAMGRRHMAGMALRVGEKNIGTIWVYRQKMINAHLLQGIAAQLSIAVSNILANDEIRRREEEKSLLLSLSNEIAAVKDKKGLSTIISQYLKDLGLIREYIIALKNEEPADTFGFFLYDEAASYAQDTLFRDKIDVNIHLIGTLEEIAFRSEGLMKYSVRELLDRGILTFPSVEYWESSDLRYIYSYPLKVSDSVIGILWIQPAQLREELLVSVAAQLAVAISNIVSLEDIRERERQKSILLSFSNDIASVKDPKELQAIVSRYLKNLWLIKEYIVAIPDEDGETFYYFLYDENSSYAQDPGFRENIGRHFPLSVTRLAETMFSSASIVYLNVKELLAEGQLFFPSVTYWENSAIETIVAVPLRSGDGIVGVLWIQPDQINERLLVGMAAQISVVVSNIVSVSRIREKEKEKTILLSFSHDIALVKTPGELQVIINRYLKNLYLIREYIIAVKNEDGQTFSFFLYDETASYTKDPAFHEKIYQRFPLSDSEVTRKIFSAQAPLYFNVKELVAQGQLFFPSVAYWENIDLETIVAVPLRASDEFIGVLWIQPDQVKDSLLIGLAAQISVAISNILSIDGLREREKEKASLLSFSNAIASAKEKSDLTTAIASHLKSLFHIERYMICVLTEWEGRQTASIYDHVGFFPRIAPPAHTATAAGPNGWLHRIVTVSAEPMTLDTRQMAADPELFYVGGVWQSAGIEKITGFPLKVGNDQLGVLWIEVSDINNNLIIGISAQIAIALANALANEKIRRQFDEINTYKQKLEEEKEYLQQEITSEFNNTEIIGNAPEMQRVFQLINQVAYSSSTVLLLGETGTGKEIAARAIHNASPRKDKLMVKVNCAALPANLIESELFGHEKGAFTGAYEKRIGKFELANNGTIFLDEIGELSLEIQAKLLRVLQEREIERIGGRTTIKVDVRIIAATNRDLLNEVEQKRFRMDLYYRLNVFPITLPPLRDRKEDIPYLATSFLQKYARNSGKKVTSLSQKVIQELVGYSWPGNVRELEHLIERSVLLAPGAVIREVHLPGSADVPGGEAHRLKTHRENERDYILEVLRYCNGKVFGPGGAAATLGLPVSTLNSRIKRLGIGKEATVFRTRNE